MGHISHIMIYHVDSGEALPRCLFSNDKDIQNQETQKTQETSRDIKRHQETSRDIKRHQETSRDIKRHQETSRDIERHRETSRDIERHRETSRDIKRQRCQFSSTCQFRLDLARCRSHDFSPGPRHQESGIEQSSTIPWILPMLELWVRWNH